VSRPDPNGCKRCGFALCDAEATNAAWRDYEQHGERFREYVTLRDRAVAARFACEARDRVDWQAVARDLAASPRAPTPEVLRAAEEVAQLAQRRTTLRDEQTKAPPREQDYIAHLLDAAEDRMVQLAVVLAEWAKGGG